MSEEFDADIVSVAALSEPVRRDLYRYVVAQDRPVGRDQAAVGVGVAHHVAKFNLDKLVADGLLDVEYSRPPGRTGPGAGRPAKLYRRADRAISVNLPERRYDLAGQVMAEAITVAARDGMPIAEALRAAAGATGRRLGAAVNGDPENDDPDHDEPDHDNPGDGDPEIGGPGNGQPGDAESRKRAIGAVLAGVGYEPRVTAAGLTLANCPFHSLAERYTDLVCGMNLHLVEGLLDALEPGDWRATLDPGPDRCCVTVGRRT